MRKSARVYETCVSMCSVLCGACVVKIETRNDGPAGTRVSSFLSVEWIRSSVSETGVEGYFFDSGISVSNGRD
jgi:hypothetical protein